MPPLRPFLHESSLRRPVVVLALLVATVLISEPVLTDAFDGIRDGSSSFPVWLPQFGSIGQTVLVYIMFFDFLKFILIPMILMWLAYAYGRYRDTNSTN